jgi:hypothetical protein
MASQSAAKHARASWQPHNAIPVLRDPEVPDMLALTSTRKFWAPSLPRISGMAHCDQTGAWGHIHSLTHLEEACERCSSSAKVWMRRHVRLQPLAQCLACARLAEAPERQNQGARARLVNGVRQGMKAGCRTQPEGSRPVCWRLWAQAPSYPATFSCSCPCRAWRKRTIPSPDMQTKLNIRQKTCDGMLRTLPLLCAPHIHEPASQPPSFS